MVDVDKPRMVMVDAIHYSAPTWTDRGRAVNEGQYSFYKKRSDGSVIAVTKAGAVLTFLPNSTATYTETSSGLYRSMRYDIEGEGLIIDTSSVDLNKSMPGAYKDNTQPDFIEFSVRGNNNTVRSPQKSVVRLVGNGNKVVTGDSADTVIVRGSDNKLYTYEGRDYVEIESGDSNLTYLGDGIDTFKAPDDDKSNIAYSGLVGHDNISGGQYIKNPNNQREFSLKKSSSKILEGAKGFGCAIGQWFKDAGSGLYNWFFNGGGSDEQWATLEEALKKAQKDRVKENLGDAFLEQYE